MKYRESLVAPTGSLLDAAAPTQIPGWDQLARGQSFYLSADWLAFADTDQVASSQYLGSFDGERLTAALSSHWAPTEIDPGYVAAEALELPANPGRVLTLGGRRGFASGVLVAPGLRRPAAADQLARLIRRATELAGFPADQWWWPYLTSPDVDVVLAAAGRLGIRPGVHLLGADCVIDLAGHTIDDHVAALSTRQRRTNFRREVRRFADSGLVIRLVSLAEHSDRLGPLLAAVQGKYGHRAAPEEFSARLRRQAELLGSRAVVFACFDGADIVGFALAYQWGGELALRVVGFDYERLPGADEYAQLAVHAPMRFCYQRGFRRLHLGTESYQAKCRRGARRGRCGR